MSNNHIEEEYNCHECPYQATARRELNKHINLKHRLKNEMTEDVIHCKYCDEQFAEKWSLMNHRKQKHPNTVAACQQNMENRCKFSSEKCWWNHEFRNISSEMSCFNCSQTFKTRGELMLHRKKEHVEKVKICWNFVSSKCQFAEDLCWFRHCNSEMQQEQYDWLK